MTPTPLLIHLHIPKNAGTTLSRMIKVRLALWPPASLLHHGTVLGCYHVEDLEARLDAVQALPEREKRRVRFFEAHAGWGMHERLPEPSGYLTMLREPVRRALSVYGHLAARGRLPEGCTLEQFLLEGDPRRVWWIDNAQVRYLAGEGGRIVDVPHGACDESMLELACRRLDDCWFAGIVERFDASMVLLRRRLGWRRCYYATSNVARKPQAAGDHPGATLELVREHNRLDTRLYEHAVRRLEEQIDAAGPGFADEVAGYERGNARYNRTVGRLYGVLPRARRLFVR